MSRTDSPYSTIYESPMNLTWKRLPFGSLDELRSMSQSPGEMRIPIMDPRTRTPLDACLGPIERVVKEDGPEVVYMIHFMYGYPTDRRNPDRTVPVTGIFKATDEGKPHYTLFFK